MPTIQITCASAKTIASFGGVSIVQSDLAHVFGHYFHNFSWYCVLKMNISVKPISRDASLLNSNKTEISYNFVQIGLEMCKLALAKKLN